MAENGKLEWLITELDKRGDYVNIGLNEYGRILIEHDDTFSTKILENTIPEESARKQKRRTKENIDEQKELVQLLLRDFTESQITKKEKPFPNLQIKTKRSKMINFIKRIREEKFWTMVEKEIPEQRIPEIRAKWDGSEQKINALKETAKKDKELRVGLTAALAKYKKSYNKDSFSLVNKIVTGHYTEMIRREMSYPWSYYEIDDALVEILNAKKEIDLEFQKLTDSGKRKIPASLEKRITAVDELLGKIEGGGRTEIGKDAGDRVLSIILPDARHLHFKRYLNSTDLLSTKWCLLDIEKPRFDTPKEEVSWVAITYWQNGVQRKEIHTSKDTGSEFTEKFYTKKNCHISLYKTESELMSGVSRSITENKPQVLSSYNTPYDYMEMRETDNGLHIGRKKASPKKESTTRFFERLKIRDMIIFDPLNWAKIAKRWLPNRKLVMIAQELGHEFEKKISYKVMAELEDIIDGKELKKCGRKTLRVMKDHTKKTLHELVSDETKLKQTCAQIIAYYVYDDTNILPKIIFSDEMKAFFRHLDVICEFANIDIQTASHTPNTINNLLKKKFFEKTGAHHDVIYPISSDQIRRETQIRNWVSRLKSRLIDKIPDRKGIFKDVSHLVIPTWPFLKDEITAACPEAKKLFDYILQHRDSPNDFYTLSQYGDSFCKMYVIAWGTYMTARNQLYKKLAKQGIKYDDAQRFTIALNELIAKTYEKHRIRDGYITQETLKNCTDYSAYEHEYFRNEPQDEYARYAQGLKIKTVTEMMLKYNWDIKDVQTLLNEWLKLKKKWNHAFVPFVSDPEFVEIQEWQIGFEKINKLLASHNVTPVFKQDQHLYVQGKPEDVKALLGEIPLIKVDTLEQVLIADHPTEGTRIYYPKHGFYNGIKIQDDASNVLNRFEMETYGKFLELVFAGELERAREHMIKQWRRIRTFDVPKKDLILHIKGKNKYKAFVTGRDRESKAIEFIEHARQQRWYDRDVGLPYVMGFGRNRDRKVYVTTVDNPNLRLDREKYQKKIMEEITCMALPVSQMLGIKLPDKKSE